MSISKLKKKFATSERLSQQGVWITCNLDEDPDDHAKPIRFLLARQGRTNRKWASQASRVYREQKRRIDAGLMSDKESLERTIRIFCNTVLLDWEGVEDDNGTPIPYNAEIAFKLLTECDGLYDYLSEESQELSNFQEEATREIVGNLKPVSTGN